MPIRASPHYGNFRWEFEDEAVEDLNAVQFVLVRLIPLLLNDSDRCRASWSTGRGRASAWAWTPSAALTSRPSIPTSWRRTSPIRSWAGSSGWAGIQSARRGKAAKVADGHRRKRHRARVQQPDLLVCANRSAAQDRRLFGGRGVEPAFAPDHHAHRLEPRPAPASRDGPPRAAALPRLLSGLNLLDAGPKPPYSPRISRMARCPPGSRPCGASAPCRCK